MLAAALRPLDKACPVSMQIPFLTVIRTTIMGRQFAKDARNSTLPNWPKELQEAYDDLTD